MITELLKVKVNVKVKGADKRVRPTPFYILRFTRPARILCLQHWLCLNSVVDLIEHYRRLFAYDGWANQEVLTGLGTAEAVPQALKLMAHIFAAERLWMERLEQKPQTLPVWPEFTAQECERQAAELPALWKKYLAASSEAELATPVTYQNSKGEAWSSRKDDILTHVITHSTHHRGQVTAALRAAGFTPAYIDFIHSIRQGFVK